MGEEVWPQSLRHLSAITQLTCDVYDTVTNPDECNPNSMVLIHVVPHKLHFLRNQGLQFSMLLLIHDLNDAAIHKFPWYVTLMVFSVERKIFCDQV